MGKIGHYIVTGALIIGVGILGGFIGNKYITQTPHSAVLRDINGDKELDLIIQDKRGRLIKYLLAAGNGTYESVEKIQEWEMKEFGEKKQKELKELLERQKIHRQELEKKVLEYIK